MADDSEEDWGVAAGARTLGLLYLCQESQSMTSEKKKMQARMMRLSMNGLFQEWF
jgi:hypothetical protein